MKRIIFFILLLFIADQGVKFYAETNLLNYADKSDLSLYKARKVALIDLTVYKANLSASLGYVRNFGAMWNLYQYAAAYTRQIIFLICGVGGLLLIVLGRKIFSPLILTFLCGGFFSNAFDRVYRGFVVDNFDLRVHSPNFWYAFPSFNLADVFLIVGILLIFLKPRFLMILFILIPGVSHAQSFPATTKTQVLQILEDYRLEKATTLKQKTQDLLQSAYSKTAAPMEQAVFLFGAGLKSYERGLYSDAEYQFKRSLKHLGEKDFLTDIVKIYFYLATREKVNLPTAINFVKLFEKKPVAKIFRKELLELKIKIFSSQKKFKELKITLDRYEKVVKRPLQNPVLLKISYEVFAQTKDSNYTNLLLERLAMQYPLHKESQFALQTILRVCPPWEFSDELLKHLSWLGPLNTGIGETLDLLIAEKIKRNSLFFDLQIPMLIKMRRLKTAEKLIIDQGTPFQKASVLARLGQTDAAIRVLSASLAQTPRINGDYSYALEFLADLLSASRQHAAAGSLYATLNTRPQALPVLKWHQFWNLYLAKDYAAARTLLERKGFLPPRDQGLDAGSEYWQAQILEKQNKSANDAQLKKIYEDILAHDVHGYYKLLVTLKMPASKRKLEITDDLEGETHNQQSNLNADAEIESSSEVVAEKAAEDPQIVYSKYFQIVKLLVDADAIKIARKVFSVIPAAEFRKNTEQVLALSDRISDFKLNFMFRSRIPISRNLPKQSFEVLRRFYPLAYMRHIESSAKIAGVDPFLLVSLMRAESYFDPQAVSQVGARGLIQLLPTTAIRIAQEISDDQFSLAELEDPKINILYASLYLRLLFDRYHHLVPVIAAYNAGPDMADYWVNKFGDLDPDAFIETLSFKETRKYVKTVTKNMAYYHWLYTKKVPDLDLLKSIPKSTIAGDLF